MLRGWDPGYIAQPLDFLGQPKNVRDLEDRLSERQASVFVELGRNTTEWSTSFIIGENRMYAEPQGQAIIVVEKNFNGTNMLLVTQKTFDQPAGIGSGMSTVIGEGLELHGSFFTRRGTRRPIHLSLLNYDFKFYGPNEFPVSDYRLHDDHWYSQWVIGGQWTVPSGLNVLLEWTHDESGLSPAQWDELVALTQFHANGASLGVPSAAVSGNLAYDADTLSRNGGSMQDYLFVRFSYPLQSLEFEISSLINTYDQSHSSGIRITYKPAQRWQTWIDMRWNQGDTGTEFGEVPVRRDTLLAMRYFF